MKAVLFSHPSAKPDAQCFASGLSEAGILGAFFTGIAAQRTSIRGQWLLSASRLMPQAANRIVEGIDPLRLRSFACTEILARGAAKLVSGTLGRCFPDGRYNAGYVASLIHDAVVSAMPWPRFIDGVYSYEDIALQTFRRAARRPSLARVYDLPTPHYAMVEKVSQAEGSRWSDALTGPLPIEPDCKKRHKDAELALATHVSVGSRFTQESVEAVGCRLPIRITPYGFPVHSFACKERIPDGPFTVLSVGNHTLRKGTPYLLEAWKQVGLNDARLRLIGRLDLAKGFLERYRGLFEHIAYMPRAQLAAQYRAADVLVFPTLADGFGLVIQEAMCCGTPVITTRCGGGPECIDHGRNGWIVAERNVDALVDTLRQVAAARDLTFRVGQAARARAEKYTWKEAGSAFSAFLAAI